VQKGSAENRLGKIHRAERVMTSKRGAGEQTITARETRAERTNAAAMAQIASDAQRVRAKTERLRALRLAKEAGDVTKRSLDE
jgi:hypothetical protein